MLNKKFFWLSLIAICLGAVAHAEGEQKPDAAEVKTEAPAEGEKKADEKKAEEKKDEGSEKKDESAAPGNEKDKEGAAAAGDEPKKKKSRKKRKGGKKSSGKVVKCDPCKPGLERQNNYRKFESGCLPPAGSDCGAPACGKASEPVKAGPEAGKDAANPVPAQK